MQQSSGKLEPYYHIQAIPEIVYHVYVGPNYRQIFEKFLSPQFFF